MTPLITFSTGGLYLYSTERAFALAADCGFDGVEVLCDERYDTRQPDVLRGLMDRYGLPVTSLHAPFPHWRLDGWPGDERAGVKHTVALAEAIGAAHVVIHLPHRLRFLTVSAGRNTWRVPLWTVETPIKTWMDSGGMAAFQAQTPVKLCVENLPLMGNALSSRWRTWWNTLAEWPQVHDYLTLDTTHWATHGIDPLQAYRAAGDRVRHVHLSNYRAGVQHLPPGDGDLDLAALLHALAGDGFDGQIVLELNPQTLHAWDEGRARALLAESLAFCREALAVPVPGMQKTALPQ